MLLNVGLKILKIGPSVENYNAQLFEQILSSKLGLKICSNSCAGEHKRLGCFLFKLAFFYFSFFTWFDLIFFQVFLLKLGIAGRNATCEKGSQLEMLRMAWLDKLLHRLSMSFCVVLLWFYREAEWEVFFLPGSKSWLHYVDFLKQCCNCELLQENVAPSQQFILKIVRTLKQ